MLLILTTSCIRDLVCLDGSGPVRTEFRDAAMITEIVNMTVADVVYIKADSVSISIKAASNIARHIVTDVTNGRLEIKNEPSNTCFARGSIPLITVTSPSVHAVDMTASGSIRADSLSGASVRIRLTGSGDLEAGSIIAGKLIAEVTASGDAVVGEAICSETDLTLTGSGRLRISGISDSGTMRVTGSGSISASDLDLMTGIFTITGSGDIHGHVINSLTAVISGSGNIYLTGNPTVNQTITGSGRVILQ